MHGICVSRFWCIFPYLDILRVPIIPALVSDGSSNDLVWYIWVCIRRMQLLSWTQSEVHHHSVSDGILHSASHWRLMFWPNKPSGLIRVWQRLCNPPHTKDSILLPKRLWKKCRWNLLNVRAGFCFAGIKGYERPIWALASRRVLLYCSAESGEERLWGSRRSRRGASALIPEQ